jgi:hypothetical protein
MRWWTKGLILSVTWLCVVVAAGYIHTDVLVGGNIAPAEEEAMSETYGIAGGFGLAVLWAICFFRLRRSSK